jgi:thioredoxin 2
MSEPSRIVICGFCGAKNRIPVEHLGQKAFCGKCHKPLSVQAYYDHPFDVNDQSFKDEVLNFPGTVLAVFWVPWCGACKMLMPILDVFARNYAGKVKVVKVNVEQNPMLSSYYKIEATPTLNFYKNGNLVRSIKGALPAHDLRQQADYILS